MNSPAYFSVSIFEGVLGTDRALYTELKIAAVCECPFLLCFFLLELDRIMHYFVFVSVRVLAFENFQVFDNNE